MILVTGATGKVGRALVTQLTGQDLEVRALSRDPDQAGLPSSVDVVAGAPDDAEALTSAFKGVDQVFVVLVGDVAGQADTFVQAARAADLDRAVLLSSSAVRHPITHPIGEEHRHAESAVRAIGCDWTFLRPGSFHSNALWWAKSIKDQNKARCLVGNQPGAPIDPADIADVAAHVLTTPGHAEQAYELTGGEVLSSAEQVRIIGETIGREIEFEVASAEEVVGIFAAISGDRAVAESNVRALHSPQIPWATPIPTVFDLLGREPRPFRAWAQENAAAFR